MVMSRFMNMQGVWYHAPVFFPVSIRALLSRYLLFAGCVLYTNALRRDFLSSDLCAGIFFERWGTGSWKAFYQK